MQLKELHIVILVTILFIGCDSNQVDYDSMTLKTEIHELINEVVMVDKLAEDELLEPMLYPYLPGYVERSDSSFKPKPPPFSPTIFPNVEFRFRECDQSISKEDEEYIRSQESVSATISLDTNLLNDERLRFGNKVADNFYNIRFNIPVFNRAHTLAYVSYSIYPSCIEDYSGVWHKTEGKWMRVHPKGNEWMSINKRASNKEYRK